SASIGVHGRSLGVCGWFSGGADRSRRVRGTLHGSVAPDPLPIDGPRATRGRSLPLFGGVCPAASARGTGAGHSFWPFAARPGWLDCRGTTTRRFLPMRPVATLLVLLIAAPALAQTPGNCEQGRAQDDLFLADVFARLFSTGSLFYGGTTWGDG